MSGPPCGPTQVVFEVLRHIAGPPPNINQAAAKAAGDYVETQLEPIKEEMKAQVEGIAEVIALMLFFLVVIPLILYIIWISYELGETVSVTIAIVIIFIVVVAIILFLAAGAISTAVDGIVNTAVTQLIKFDNPNATNALLVSLEGAAAQYVQAVGGHC